MSRISSLPKSKIDKVMKYADDIDHWVDMDLGVDRKTARKHQIKHSGFEISFSLAFKNDDDDNTVGELPIRCVTFRYKEEELDATEKEIDDFIQRTLDIFGFDKPEKVEGNKGVVHYHEQLFTL